MKIAVLVRNRQSEALRMALGLALLDAVVDVFVLDRKLEETEDCRLHLSTLRDFDFRVCTNHPENEGMEVLSREEIAARLPQYDHALAY